MHTAAYALFRHQRNFRVLLKALAWPGRRLRLEVDGLPAPAWAVAECLLDQEVSFGLIGGGSHPAASVELAAATGSRPAAPAEADFVFAGDAAAVEAIRTARRGRPESPEEAATVVVSLTERSADPAARLRVRLTGPGIAAPQGIAPEMNAIPLPAYEALAEANADYPLGVDALFLDAQGGLMALPRSTRIRIG